MGFRTGLGTLACVIWASSSLSYAAADGPTLSVDIVTELQYENGIGPEEAKPQSDFLFTTIEAGIGLNFTDRFVLESVVLVEIFDEPVAGDDSLFQDHGLFVEELKLAYHGDNWSAFTGKFNTAFGVGWDLGSGIWGVDFPEDYEVAEKIGFGTTKTFGSERNGIHTLYASAYQADRSFLSESLLDNRGRVHLADGGVTNTDGPESFTLSLTGEDVFGHSGLGYHIAYRSHAHGDANFNAERENGFAASVFGVTPFVDAELEGLIEAVHISNSEGSDHDVTYITAGGTLYFAETWNAALSVTFRNTNVPGGASINDYRFQATTGFVWDSGVSFDFGYRHSKEDGVDNHVVGFLMAYEFSL